MYLGDLFRDAENTIKKDYKLKKEDAENKYE